MVELKYRIVEQKIQKVNNPFLVSKSRNYLKISFTFNKTWKELTKYIIFDNEYEFILEQTDKRYSIVVPSQLLLKDNFYFTIYGANNNGVLITTENVEVNLEETGYTDSVRPIDGDLDKEVFTDIYNKLDTKFDDVVIEDGYLICYANGVELDRIALSEYYTKDEIDSALDDKAELIHTHTIQDITDWETSFIDQMDVTIFNLIGRV